MTVRMLPMLSLLLVAACSSSEEGGAGGGGGVAGQEDFDALAACAEGLACSTDVFAQRIESGEAFSMIGVECVLAALRDRSPGVLEIELLHSYSNGTDVRLHRYVVTASGEVETAARHQVYSDESEDGLISVEITETRRCTLKPASFFEDCLAQLELDSAEDSGTQEAAWDCVFPAVGEEPPWLESCAAAAPTCE